ncbi:hypothetical protein PV328_001244 [Microctonus aethiopoides]|uniref:Uncharacterized protein n=1 Tax=Microctonus aethiopoides TaxID=144406 RepID=A0AA39FWI8_9HYME|nr:hypothetical protein PV328_001244 [Microctonus aethiopoides]
MSDRSKSPTLSEHSGRASPTLSNTEKPATATTTAAATTRRSPTPTIKLDVPTTTNVTTDPEMRTADHRAGRSASPIITEDPPTTETYNLQHASNVDATHKAFVKEHAYSEVSWPAEHISHNYWKETTFFHESYLYSRIKCRLTALQKPVPSLVMPAAESSTMANISSRLPELTLPTFKGDLKD